MTAAISVSKLIWRCEACCGAVELLLVREQLLRPLGTHQRLLHLPRPETRKTLLLMSIVHQTAVVKHA
jgi:transcription termination factor Rho